MLIAIEGCVGAGKSTVAKGLASCRGSKLLLEDFESNPFLHAFYDDPTSNAIETEFAFLLLHFHQLKSQARTASGSEVVADFHLGKDLLYADLNLKDSRLKRLFTELYDICIDKTPRPALVIFLSATTELLVQRIRARKRDFELEVDPAYYGSVNAAYEEYFARYPGKKLRIPMDEWDFVQDEQLYERLSSLVDGALLSK
jgi:deoxyguanosine kinase